MMEKKEIEKLYRYKKNYDDKMYLKYLLDKVCALLLILLSAGFIITAVILTVLEGIIDQESRRGIFMLEKRITQDRPFLIYKFNIAYPKSLKEKPSGLFSLFFYRKDLKEGEAYMVGEATVLGRIIKNCYLDELPQLFNILKGDMTFVGPRPLPPALYKKNVAKGMISKKILRAGLTGTVQMNKSILDIGDEKIYAKAELEYIENIDKKSPLEIIFYDLYIIYRTVYVVFKAEGL